MGDQVNQISTHLWREMARFRGSISFLAILWLTQNSPFRPKMRQIIDVKLLIIKEKDSLAADGV